ncbi:hypothetical protein FACS1894110_10160 [Spirochaetia bacterium]|nr:hypothetical protein FACS1894110_10160 [Spirochaetia bacterium]
MNHNDLEAPVLAACKQYLDLRGIAWIRINGAGIKIPLGGGRYRWFRSYTCGNKKNGVADLIAVKDGLFYAIECKSGSGKQSDDQKEFQEYVEKSGGIYIIARDIQALKERGL